MNTGIFVVGFLVGTIIVSIGAGYREAQIKKEYETKLTTEREASRKELDRARKELDRALNLILSEVLHRTQMFWGSPNEIMQDAERVKEQRLLKEKVTDTLAGMLPSKGDGMVVSSGTPVPEELVQKVMEGMKEKEER